MDSLNNIHNDSILRFGPYVFHVAQRLVMQDDVALRVGGRALDILQVLVEQAGSVVGKDALIARVWHNSVVEDINLRVQVAALRRALGDGRNGQRYIETVPQRGYCFVARVEHVEADNQMSIEPPAPRHNLPVRLTPVIGRDEVVGRIVRQLPGRRFMTLVGPGGIGKSAVAGRVSEALLRHYPDGVWNIDFSTPDGAQQVAAQLVAALGFARQLPLNGLVAALAGRRALLIFDGCEHQPESARRWAQSLLPDCQHLSILATSRQPLLAAGESVLRLSGLAIAPNDAQDAMAYAAMQLFVRRARACQQDFVLREQDVPVVGDICRRLDGIPLAIELAAARINVFGLTGLQARLDSCFQSPSLGRRTAVARHQSFKASLDWSYERLDFPEQTVLQRLAVFTSAFTPEAAIEVVACALLSADCVGKTLQQLADKSLLSLIQGSTTLRYGLLHTTRVYAREKLQHSGDAQLYEARLARYLAAGRFSRIQAPSLQLVE
ncbi:winged helix-turn-helix domain-containing protein [Pseudomonas cichorii]|uniref:ATP-binding protein n=1 Tax=Pseudomonas cichorii TaxID=36746 RepID=UPI000EFEA86B|nr:winged helix-turn-helix domain-containing protein [Pseudomonas cichorii]